MISSDLDYVQKCEESQASLRSTKSDIRQIMHKLCLDKTQTAKLKIAASRAGIERRVEIVQTECMPSQNEMNEISGELVREAKFNKVDSDMRLIERWE